MKKYKVNVNGTEYEVEIEEIEGSRIPRSAFSRPSSSRAPIQQPKVQPSTGITSVASATPEDNREKPAATTSGGVQITAPMPGNILSVRVSNGQTVKKGDLLFILEAMKMENEILAPCDGTVTSLSISEGATVLSDALLCTID